MKTPSIVLMACAVAFAACASSQASRAPGDDQASAQLHADIQDLKANLRQFGAEVSEFADSAAHPESVNDPQSFRARERAAELRLTQRAAGLRADIKAATAAPAPERQRMMNDLDASEKQLDQTRQKMVR